MRLIAFLPLISLFSSCAYASPVGYNLRRSEDPYQGGKQFITTVMVITKTMTLEIDHPPMTTAPASTESIPPPAKSTPPPKEGPEVTVTEVVTVTKKKTTTLKQDPAPSTTKSLSRLNPLSTTEKVEAPKTTTTKTVEAPKTTTTKTVEAPKITTCIDTTTTSAPVPDVTEQPSPSPEVPTLQPTSTYRLSRLNPFPSETPTPPAEPTTTETPTSKTTIAETTTPEPAPTSTPQPEKPSSSKPEAPTTTGFVPPTDPGNTGPFLKENIPLAIKRNQEYSGIKEGDECDPSAYLLACAGTMGNSILQCGATKTYETVLSCLRDDRCFATPQLLAPGVMVTCDTPENAGKKFNMRADELLKEIGNGKGDKDSYRRKRRTSTPSKNSYREVHYRS